MTEPVIDKLVFNEIADLMGDSMGEFIETYLGNSPKLIEGINIALPAGDTATVIHNAHQLKGGSGSIGAMQVFQYAKRMEEDGKDGQLDGLPAIFTELKVAYDEVESELRKHL